MSPPRLLVCLHKRHMVFRDLGPIEDRFYLGEGDLVVDTGQRAPWIVNPPFEAAIAAGVLCPRRGFGWIGVSFLDDPRYFRDTVQFAPPT